MKKPAEAPPGSLAMKIHSSPQSRLRSRHNSNISHSSNGREIQTAATGIGGKRRARANSNLSIEAANLQPYAEDSAQNQEAVMRLTSSSSLIRASKQISIFDDEVPNKDTAIFGG